MHTLSILAPVFLLILLGAVLRRGGFLAGEAPRVLSRYCYWIALPPLLFLKIGLAEADMGSALSTLTICAAVTLSLAVVGLVVALAIRLPPTRAVTMMHVTMRGNLAYVGLPIVIFAFSAHPQGQSAEAIAALVIGPLVILYNLIPSIAHVIAAHSGGKGLKRRLLLKLSTNPLILACLAGLVWNRLVAANGTELPLILLRTLELLGGPALPLALLCVGCGLADTRSLQAAIPSSIAACMKNLLSILLTILFARLLNAGPIETAVALILMAAPTAVASFILVEELNGDPNIAASTITLSTLLSLLTLPLALSLAL
jgi:predicted permease